MEASRKSPEAVCCRALISSLAPAELLLEMVDLNEEVRSRADFTPSFTPELALNRPEEPTLNIPDDPDLSIPLSACRNCISGQGWVVVCACMHACIVVISALLMNRHQIQLNYTVTCSLQTDVNGVHPVNASTRSRGRW